MLSELGLSSLDQLVDSTVPQPIRLKKELALDAPLTEQEILADLSDLAARNRIFRSYLGMGYHDCITPAVIRRTILENPGWYTQYTPYQAEIAQGRLEALLNFQTMVIDLTGLEIANASVLDEATAAAEAMALCRRVLEPKARGNVFFVSNRCHPQTIEVVRGRAGPLEIEVVVGDHESYDFSPPAFGVLLQYPTTDGEVLDYAPFCRKAHEEGTLVAVAADLLSLTLLRPPGEFGADVAVGNSQRFGVPLGYGGPHAAFMATRDAYKRQLPGRLAGVSKDSSGRSAIRLALQTREQHIRRDKATSNLCTSQVLLAVIASMYAIYHGPEGLRRIARRLHQQASAFAGALEELGFERRVGLFFDTLRVSSGPLSQVEVLERARQRRINLRTFDNGDVGIALDETVSVRDLNDLWEVFGGRPEAAPFRSEAGGDEAAPANEAARATESPDEYPEPHRRATEFLMQTVFRRYHCETEMLRYMKRLESRDMSLTYSMIPLGSCTMKLNAAAEMYPISYPGFASIHPFAPIEQTAGYQELFRRIGKMLCELTGFPAVSLMPNAGAQGEYAGLLTIRAYHASRGESGRNVCLIPVSAHGTNPASAVMAGLTVVPVGCDAQGNIDIADLRAKAGSHRSRLAALMVTYPSTHGVFEEGIREFCEIAHEAGGQVYLDGANMNALVGLCRPAEFGADLCHLNLHKTFCIPHGGGGPGMGPICVASHLAPFLPRHPFAPVGGERGIGPVSEAPWGSAGILPISYAYLAMMGAAGLKPSLPGVVQGERRPRGARVHRGSEALEILGEHRRGRRGEASDGLRLPRPDDVLARGRHPDDRADGERAAGGAGPLL